MVIADGSLDGFLQFLGTIGLVIVGLIALVGALFVLSAFFRVLNKGIASVLGDDWFGVVGKLLAVAGVLGGLALVYFSWTASPTNYVGVIAGVALVITLVSLLGNG